MGNSMDNIEISKDQFDEAVAQVAVDLAMEHSNQSEGTFLFNLTGMAFAARLRHKLFDEQEDD